MLFRVYELDNNILNKYSPSCKWQNRANEIIKTQLMIPFRSVFGACPVFLAANNDIGASKDNPI